MAFFKTCDDFRLHVNVERFNSVTKLLMNERRGHVSLRVSVCLSQREYCSFYFFCSFDFPPIACLHLSRAAKRCPLAGRPCKRFGTVLSNHWNYLSTSRCTGVKTCMYRGTCVLECCVCWNSVVAASLRLSRSGLYSGSWDSWPVQIRLLHDQIWWVTTSRPIQEPNLSLGYIC